MENDNAGLGIVFIGILTAFVMSGLALVVVGEVIRRRGARRGAWFTIGAGVVVLLIPAAVLTFPAVLS